MKGLSATGLEMIGPIGGKGGRVWAGRAKMTFVIVGVTEDS